MKPYLVRNLPKEIQQKIIIFSINYQNKLLCKDIRNNWIKKKIIEGIQIFKAKKKIYLWIQRFT